MKRLVQLTLCLSALSLLPCFGIGAAADPPPLAEPDRAPVVSEPPPLDVSQALVASSVLVYSVEGDGLAEANAKRAARGLRPFLYDPGLTIAARGAAAYRAQYRMFGHTSNDFQFVPAGTRCDATGCAAYPADYGWLTCATYDDYTRAGAYWVLGDDGKRYMHLCVGYGAPVDALPVAGQACPAGMVCTVPIQAAAAPPPPVVVPVVPAPPPGVTVKSSSYSSFSATSGTVGVRRIAPVRNILGALRGGAGCGGSVQSAGVMRFRARGGCW